MMPKNEKCRFLVEGSERERAESECYLDNGLGCEHYHILYVNGSQYGGVYCILESERSESQGAGTISRTEGLSEADKMYDMVLPSLKFRKCVSSRDGYTSVSLVVVG